MIIGIAEITPNGVCHVLAEIQSPDEENEINGIITTMCGTEAPQRFQLNCDVWGFLDLEDAGKRLSRCHRPCKRCLRKLKEIENDG